MRICVDLRCLQGQGKAAATVRPLLVGARSSLGTADRLVGVIDESLPALPADCAALLDETRFSLGVPRAPTVFVQPSPLTPPPPWPAPLPGRPRILTCAVVDDHTIPEQPAGQRFLTERVWLSSHDLFATTTESAARRLCGFLDLAPDRVVVMGADPGRFWAEVRCWQQRLTLGCRRGARRPRLAVLSPYPPECSGVADYTAACTRSLARRAAIDVFTAAFPPRPDPWVRNFAPLSDQPYASGEYDRVLAVVGNHPFHATILALHLRYGGACLVHDNRLTELYAWLHGPERFAQLASRNLGRPVAVEEAQSWLLDTHRLPAPFLDEVVVNSDPLIVHSPGTQAQVVRHHGRPVARLPFCCHRSFTPDELTPSARQAARARLGLPDDRLLIICPGVSTPVKGPLECIWALDQLRAWRVAADLHFVGPVPFLAETFRTWAHRLGLEDHIRIRDEWFPESTYRDYLLAADLAIQLRAPGFVGVSASALDCVSAGVPTVMNRALADALAAPNYVVRVPDFFSPVLIAERLLELIDSGTYRHRLFPERAEYLAAHDFDHYADELLRVLGLG